MGDRKNDVHISRYAKAELLARLEAIYRDQPPQPIYFRALHRIFSELLEELDEERIIETRTGIEDTLVWRKLYRFQRDGVLGVIDKIERYNRCILADSVGLGKTFDGLAVIEYYAPRNDRVLVLCPKKPAGRRRRRGGPQARCGLDRRSGRPFRGAERPAHA